ncbi:MAG: helix-turn-helix domain-containing protein [Bacteroidetes bacterium]|nr:helix-turn-helix domain-containing protein [Bacteroidota bacterium]
MTQIPNSQIELAFDFVQFTNRNIYLTGKAGTGKTTFLHRVKKESIKRTVVVAPTGVAAINARGMTIHSMFQLPFGPFLPGNTQDLSRQRKFSRKKINLIKSLDLLIIDEISMVRSDLLDAIDDVLKRFKNPSKPFGGVQLLMIGDLHQLPPVVKEDEWRLLNEFYETPYFFGSRALQQTSPISIELKHIYRQSDSAFIDLLNKVRDNQLNKEVLETLNSRYIQNFKPAENEAYITLTSHNASAQKINREQLKSIPELIHKFTAEVTGDFPPHTYPTDEVLEFKRGAQVLFIKNDPSPEKLFYNGKIGQIMRIEEDVIYVRCPNEYEEIAVSKSEWKNIKYNLNEETKEVTEEEVGTYTQYPLKLAWAITIHKSQGLTFERAIIDAKSAFAHGQVYVALSRCKSFEGIVLRSKIEYSSVKTDSVVRHYSNEASKNEPTESDLQQSKRDYQKALIRELFNFKIVQNRVEAVNRVFLEHENTLTTSVFNQFKTFGINAETTLFSVARKFQPQLERYFNEPELPEANEDLQTRIRKAGNYFFGKIDKELHPELKKIPILADNKVVVKKVTDALKNLEMELFIKQTCFKVVQKAFSVQEYNKAKTGAELDFEKIRKKRTTSTDFSNIPNSIPHPELYAQLLQWRKEIATDYGVANYEIVAIKTLLELVKYLPTGTADLKRIKGIGPAKTKQFGADITGLIQDYCEEKSIPANLLSVKVSKKKPKKDTKKISFDLFKEGKSIEEIAQERGYVKTTIEGHLGHYVGLGELDILDLLEEYKVDELEDYFVKNKTVSSKEAKAYFGEKYSYAEIKMVLLHLRSKKN